MGRLINDRKEGGLEKEKSKEEIAEGEWRKKVKNNEKGEG